MPMTSFNALILLGFMTFGAQSGLPQGALSTSHVGLAGIARASAPNVGQYSIVAGKYSDSSDLYVIKEVSLLVAKGKPKNWTVQAVLTMRVKAVPPVKLQGTLYDSGKLSLKETNPPRPPGLTIDGFFDKATGEIEVEVKRGPSRIASFTCTNSHTALDKSYRWVLKEGYPKYESVYLSSPKPFSVDASGKVIWPATSLVEGKPISQTISFTQPKKEYLQGETWEMVLDASATVKGAYPFVGAGMYFGWISGGQVLVGNDNSAHSIAIDFKSKGKLTFNPESEEKAIILVGASGMGGMVWAYRRAPLTGPVPPDPKEWTVVNLSGTALHPSGEVNLVRQGANTRLTNQTIEISDRFVTGPDGSLRISKGGKDLVRLGVSSTADITALGRESLGFTLRSGSLECLANGLEVKVLDCTIESQGVFTVYLEGSMARVEVKSGFVTIKVGSSYITVKGGESWMRAGG